jgi:hypothetical protein
MINDNIANCIASSGMKVKISHSGNCRQVGRLSRRKVVVSTFQKSVCRALNASATSIQNMRADHRRADITAVPAFPKRDGWVGFRQNGMAPFK